MLSSAIEDNVRRAFRRTLKLAELPAYFTPHCLRHTFASLLISHGKPIVYVQRQLGPRSITLTVDTYGMWLPMADRAPSMPSTIRLRTRVVAKR